MKVKIRTINKRKIVNKGLIIKLKEPKNEILLTEPLVETVELHRFITNAYFGMNELLMVYAATPLSDYIGGYSEYSQPKKNLRKHLPKRGYFI